MNWSWPVGTSSFFVSDQEPTAFLLGKWIEARIRHCERFAICISAACQMASKIDFYHSSPCSRPPTTRSFPLSPPDGVEAVEAVDADP